jgi:hypothetical protein
MTADKNKKDPSIVTFRLTEELSKRYSRIRESYRKKGVKKSVAQIAKEELLENEQRKTRRDRIDILSALQKDHAGTLVRLRNMIIKDESLTREEWQFLCLEAATAYSIGRRGSLDSALLSDTVKAFRDFYRLRNKHYGITETDGRYYLGNLIKPENREETVTLETALEFTLERINRKPLTDVGGNFIVRNLEVCFRDEPDDFPEMIIQQALAPYGKSLLTLAAYAYYKDSVRQTGVTQPYTEFQQHDWMTQSWSKWFENEFFTLDVQSSDGRVFAMLTMKHDNGSSIMHPLGFHPMDNLFTAIKYVAQIENYQCFDFNIRGERHTDIQLDSHRWCLTIEQYEKFKQLVIDVLADNEFNEVWKIASLVYGRI